MKTINLLMIVAVVAVTIAAVNLIIQFDEIKEMTGFATDTGFANLTITPMASVSFTTSTINWGVGAVDEAPTSALLDTTNNSVVDGNWTAVSQSLVLRNDGNVNVSLSLQTSNNADGFIGGTNPTYKLNVTETETGSCSGTNNVLSSMTDANASAQLACSNFSYYDDKDTFDIDVQLRIPEDATPGAKGTIITATATYL